MSKSSFKVNVNAELMSTSWCVACAMSSCVSCAKSKLRHMLETFHKLCHILDTSCVEHGDTFHKLCHMLDTFHELCHMLDTSCVGHRDTFQCEMCRTSSTHFTLKCTIAHAENVSQVWIAESI